MIARFSSNHGSICRKEKEMQPYDDGTEAQAWQLEQDKLHLQYVYGACLEEKANN